VEKINEKYYKKIEENFKNIENILLKDKISEFDVRICCLEMRFAIENICYNQLEKYGDLLSDEEKKKYYQANKITKEIIQVYNPFITRNGHDIKIELTGENINDKKSFDLKTLSAEELNGVYNKLGKQLHSQQPFENAINFDKEKLKEIFNKIKSFRTSFGTLMSHNVAECIECKEKFVFQKILNVKKNKNNEKLDEIFIYCPFCLSKYKMVDDRLKIEPTYAHFVNENTKEKIPLYSNISIKRIIVDLRKKILEIKDYDNIPKDCCKYDFYKENKEKIQVYNCLADLFKFHISD